jgi:hypothetical protein
MFLFYYYFFFLLLIFAIWVCTPTYTFSYNILNFVFFQVLVVTIQDQAEIRQILPKYKVGTYINSFSTYKILCSSFHVFNFTLDKRPKVTGHKMVTAQLSTPRDNIHNRLVNPCMTNEVKIFDNVFLQYLYLPNKNKDINTKQTIDEIWKNKNMKQLPGLLGIENSLKGIQCLDKNNTVLS